MGDKVSSDETIAEIETDKTNLSVNTPQAGVIEEYLVSDGDTVTSGAQIAKVNTNTDAKSSSSSSSSSDKKEKPKVDDTKKSTDQVDAERTKEKPSESSNSSKPSGGSKRDTSAPQKQTPSTSQVSGLDPNKISGTRSETRVKMSRMRLKIAERLKEAQNTCAMLTTFNEIDMR